MDVELGDLLHASSRSALPPAHGSAPPPVAAVALRTEAVAGSGATSIVSPFTFFTAFSFFCHLILFHILFCFFLIKLSHTCCATKQCAHFPFSCD
jgi:hypothetical protein